MRTFEDIERDLKNAQEEAKPIIKAREKAVAKINQYYHELEQFKLDNGLYRPMSDLEQCKGKEIYHIKLVQRKEDGTLSCKDMYNDEMFDVDKNGHLYYSSYQCGIMGYSEKDGKYIYTYHGREMEYDFVGFTEISVDDED